MMNLISIISTRRSDTLLFGISHRRRRRRRLVLPWFYYNNTIGIIIIIIIIFTLLLVIPPSSVYSFVIIQPSSSKFYSTAQQHQQQQYHYYHQQKQQQPSRCATATTLLFLSSSKKSSSSKSNIADFEYQELRALMYVMERDNISSKQLNPIQRNDMEKYANAIINKRQCKTINISYDILINTKWRLSFTTDNITLFNLPNDATIYIDFISKTKLIYILQFSRTTFGLNSIQVECNYSIINNNNNNNNNESYITYTYDKVTTNIFGFNNINIGFFGLLQGRTNYISLQDYYFDNTIWIERTSTYNNNNNNDSTTNTLEPSSAVNVYVRQQ